MGPSILFAKGESTSKTTEGPPGTLRTGLVGACPSEGSLLEKTDGVLLLAKGSGLRCLPFPGGRDPQPQSPLFSASANGQHPFTPGDDVFLWTAASGGSKLLSGPGFADPRESSLGSPQGSPPQHPLVVRCGNKRPRRPVWFL